jgi:pyruvate dehydrogenase E2 component (dihydrolipoamide acetyltransferase)
MERATIARWLKAEGAVVSKGDILAEVETDKATLELEAEVSGTVGRLLVGDGTEVAVDQMIAVILKDGEAIPNMPVASIPLSAGPAPFPPPIVGQAEAERAQTDRIFASPLARRLATDKGIEISTLSGSGPKGRVVRIDVERAASLAGVPSKSASATLPAPASSAALAGGREFTEVPLSTMRRVIARRLLEAKTTIPHFYLTVDCQIDALLSLRAEVNAIREKDNRISVNDFVVKAAAYALSKVPAANAIWTENAILLMKDIDVSVAVATDGGLITPIVRNADRKSLGTVSAEIRDLATRARAGKLKPEEFQGGGFSVSNLGMYGVKSFSAIINPPQSCILAVGAAERRPICRADDIVPGTMMACTLSVDHRSVDGALGAEVLAVFRQAIEQPMSLLV